MRVPDASALTVIRPHCLSRFHIFPLVFYYYFQTRHNPHARSTLEIANDTKYVVY